MPARYVIDLDGVIRDARADRPGPRAEVGPVALSHSLHGSPVLDPRSAIHAKWLASRSS
jgi:hypothetical protein